MSYLRLDNISKSFGNKRALRGISLDIEEETFCVFLGPSGCGKSTLLNIVAGLEEPGGGSVRMGGRDITGLPPHKRDMAMVFQNYALYPHLNVFENMAFGLRAKGVAEEGVKERVREAARILGIEGMLDNYPRQLSGGERQRVATGRAIVRDPNLFLFDEPLSNLDAGLRLELRKEFLFLHQRLRKTSLYVTHDQSEALSLGDVIVVLKDGRVQQVSAPRELYDDPRNLFVAGFIGTPPMNIIEAEVKRREGKIELVKNGFAVRPGKRAAEIIEDKGIEKVFVGIRPAAMSLRENGKEHVLDGKARFSELLGEEVMVYIQLGDDLEIKAVFPRHQWSGETKNIRVCFAGEDVYFFGPGGERL